MSLIAAFSLSIPSAYSRFLATEDTVRDEALLNIGLAVVLLAAYALYLLFQLKTHPEEFAGQPGAISGEQEAAHGPRWSLARAPFVFGVDLLAFAVPFDWRRAPAARFANGNPPRRQDTSYVTPASAR